MSFTKRIPFEMRFLSFFKPGHKDLCWLWNGSPNSAGYGTIRRPGRMGRTLLAHRVAYELHWGYKTDGLCVCHRCDVRLCVNPFHLFIGTVADNNADRDRKGRCRASGKPGELCGRAKLTNAQAKAILSDSRTQQKIANDYGVARATISRLRNGHSFRFLRTVGKWKETP